jgi:hypothetical protein
MLNTQDSYNLPERALRRDQISLAIDIGTLSLLMLVAIAANLRLIQDGVNGLGDARWHLTWLQHFSKQLGEGILYPRWLAGTNFGYGSPTFVFYPPLVYYLGSGFRLLGIGFETTVSLMFTLGVFLSGGIFYLCGRQRWGWQPAAGGAVFYMLSPGLIGTVFSGGLAPLYSYLWPPLLIYLTEKAKTSPKGLCGLTVVWALVALTHLPSLLIYTVAWGIYTLIDLRHASWRQRLQIWTSAPLGWGIAAFFLVPAVLEQRYINIGYMLASQSGFEAKMPQLQTLLADGWDSIFVRQWVWAGAIAAIAWLNFTRYPQQRQKTLILLATSGFIVFLICDASWFLWQYLPTLQKIESSGRLDRLLYFTEAILFTLAIQSVFVQTGRFRQFSQTISLLCLAAIALSNFHHNHQQVRDFPGLHSSGNGVMENRPWITKIVENPFQDNLIDVPEYRPRLVDKSNPNSRGEFLQYQKEIQTNEGLPATLTTTVGSLPTPQPNQPQIDLRFGQGTVKELDWQSYQRRFQLVATTPLTIRLRVYAYPAWQLRLNGQLTAWQISPDGRISFQVKPGNYAVELRYEKTTAFRLGLCLSASSISIFIWLSLVGWPNYGNFACLSDQKAPLPPRFV